MALAIKLSKYEAQCLHLLAMLSYTYYLIYLSLTKMESMISLKEFF